MDDPTGLCTLSLFRPCGWIDVAGVVLYSDIMLPAPRYIFCRIQEGGSNKACDSVYPDLFYKSPIPVPCTPKI